MFRRDSTTNTGGGRSAFGLPRRYLNLLVLVVLLILIATFSTPTTRSYVSPAPDSSYHPVNWLPDSIFNNLGFAGVGAAPKEFDDLGRCLFMSPFEALSQREQERASQVELEHVSDGIVRAKQALFHHHATQGESQNKSAPADASVATLTNPILALLKDGERKWKAMVSGQSKTLEEAVEEYKIRWNRNPPLGFDEWYVASPGCVRYLAGGRTNMLCKLGGHSSLNDRYCCQTNMTREFSLS